MGTRPQQSAPLLLPSWASCLSFCQLDGAHLLASESTVGTWPALCLAACPGWAWEAAGPVRGRGWQGEGWLLLSCMDTTSQDSQSSEVGTHTAAPRRGSLPINYTSLCPLPLPQVPPMRQDLFPPLLGVRLRGWESADALPISSNLILSTTLWKWAFSALFRR